MSLEQSVALFDFSERKQSNRAAIAVPGTQLGGRQETVCVATRVGDALQEPFWPEGLGINVRGPRANPKLAAARTRQLPYRRQ